MIAIELQETVYRLDKHALRPCCIGYICEDTEPGYDPAVFEPIPQAVEDIESLYAGSGKEAERAYRLFRMPAKADGGPFLPFSELDFCPDQRVFWFFCIICKEDTDVVMTLESIGFERVWINAEIAALWGRENTMLLTYTLQAGKNIICMEQFGAQPFLQAALRISPLREESLRPSNAIVGNLLTYKTGGVYIWELGDTEYRHGKPYRFIVCPMDYIWTDQDAKVDILVRQRETQEVLTEASCRMLEICTIETAPLRRFQSSPMSCLELVFRYPLLDGNLREHVRPLHVIPHENYILPLVERGTALLNSGGLSEDEIRCLQFYLNEVPREREDTPETFVQWEDFHEHLKKMENGTYVQSLQEGGAHTIYFRSKLDDAVTFYHLCLPKNYQPEKKYPLLISFSILRMDTYSHMFADAQDLEDMIVVDVHGRGVTMGSYIGDASIKEILSDLFSRYAVDTSRVYGMGFCSGAAAAWNQVQYSPDLYAGVYTCLIGPQYSLMKNLHNISVHYVCTPQDISIKHMPKKLRKYIPDLHIHTISEARHLDFHDIFYCKDAIRALMRAKKRPFPREIYFRTDKNRYRRSGWITIHSIEYGKTFAFVHAVIRRDDIYITAQNLTGLTVEFPPFLKKRLTAVYLNRKRFDVETKDGSCRFIKGRGGFMLSSQPPAKVALFKGTGCADVFLTPLRILNYLPESERCAKAAAAFMSPKNMGFFSETQIWYPLYTPEELKHSSEQILRDNSLIVFSDSTCHSDILQKIRAGSALHTDAGGFYYLGKYHKTAYCIFQILENPWNPDMSILSVSFSSDVLLSENFYTRSMILPAYQSGYHPYLNGMALIYDGHKYYTVREFGMEPEEIDGKFLLYDD